MANDRNQDDDPVGSFTALSVRASHVCSARLVVPLHYRYCGPYQTTKHSNQSVALPRYHNRAHRTRGGPYGAPRATSISASRVSLHPIDPPFETLTELGSRCLRLGPAGNSFALAALLCCLFTLAGCAKVELPSVTAPFNSVVRPDGPKYVDAPAPPRAKGLATVYLYYLGRPGARMPFDINGQHYFTAHWNSYTWLQLAPGQYVFGAEMSSNDIKIIPEDDWKARRELRLRAEREKRLKKRPRKRSRHEQPPAAVKLKLDKGKTYYLALTQEGTMTGNNPQPIAGIYFSKAEYKERKRAMLVIDKKAALRALHDAVYIPSSGRWPE